MHPEKWTRKFAPCFDPYGVSRELTGVDAVDAVDSKCLETPEKAGISATKAQ